MILKALGFRKTENIEDHINQEKTERVDGNMTIILALMTFTEL